MYPILTNYQLYKSDLSVSCILFWYDREGIFASGAADDAIRLFVDDNESQVCQFSPFLTSCIYLLTLAV